MAQTEAQKRASKNYRLKNPEKTHDVAMRAVKSAIKNHATDSDIKLIKKWIIQKQTNIPIE